MRFPRTCGHLSVGNGAGRAALVAVMLHRNFPPNLKSNPGIYGASAPYWKSGFVRSNGVFRGAPRGNESRLRDVTRQGVRGQRAARSRVVATMAATANKQATPNVSTPNQLATSYNHPVAPAISVVTANVENSLSD